MSIYVDGAVNAFGRMKMCHMLADSTDELVAMAVALGLKVEWLQKRGQPDEHFDICKSKRALAVKMGAIEVSSRALVGLIRARRLRLEPGGEGEGG